MLIWTNIWLLIIILRCNGFGHGICEYWGCNPKDVDILMVTFTKSFSSARGYIAGSKVGLVYTIFILQSSDLLAI